jgi:hypothetical protein
MASCRDDLDEGRKRIQKRLFQVADELLLRALTQALAKLCRYESNNFNEPNR